MGSKTPEEKAAEEKINYYQEVIDTAYLLFDNKYDMEFINSVPYKDLIKLIDHEQKLSKEYKEIKAARSLENQLR